MARQNALAAGLADPQPPARDVGTGRYPQALLSTIDAALATDPAQRLQTVDAMLAALGREGGRRTCRVMPGPAPRAATAAAPRSPRVLWGAAAGVWRRCRGRGGLLHAEEEDGSRPVVRNWPPPPRCLLRRLPWQRRRHRCRRRTPPQPPPISAPPAATPRPGAAPNADPGAPRGAARRTAAARGDRDPADRTAATCTVTARAGTGGGSCPAVLGAQRRRHPRTECASPASRRPVRTSTGCSPECTMRVRSATRSRVSIASPARRSRRSAPSSGAPGTARRRWCRCGRTSGAWRAGRGSDRCRDVAARGLCRSLPGRWIGAPPAATAGFGRGRPVARRLDCHAAAGRPPGGRDRCGRTARSGGAAGDRAGSRLSRSVAAGSAARAGIAGSRSRDGDGARRRTPGEAAAAAHHKLAIREVRQYRQPSATRGNVDRCGTCGTADRVPVLTVSP